MHGILVAAHGSRSPEVHETMQFIMKRTKELVPECLVQLGYLGVGSPNIEEGLEILRGKGIEKITMIPYFLFQGVHVKETIPEIAEEYQRKHPEVVVEVGSALGEDERLAAVLAQRIREVL